MTLWGNLYLWSGLLIVLSLTSFKWIIYKFLKSFLNFKWTECWNKLKLIRDIKMCFCYFSVECRWLMLVFIVFADKPFFCCLFDVVASMGVQDVWPCMCLMNPKAIIDKIVIFGIYVYFSSSVNNSSGE